MASRVDDIHIAIIKPDGLPPPRNALIVELQGYDRWLRSVEGCCRLRNPDEGAACLLAISLLS